MSGTFSSFSNYESGQQNNGSSVETLANKTGDASGDAPAAEPPMPPTDDAAPPVEL